MEAKREVEKLWDKARPGNPLASLGYTGHKQNEGRHNSVYIDSANLHTHTIRILTQKKS